MEVPVKQDLSMSGRYVFRYPGQTYQIIAGVLIAAMGASLGFGIENGPPTESTFGKVMVWFGVILFLSFVVMIWFGKADIVVDDQIIARRTWGWIWKKLHWREVRRIRAIHGSRPNGKRSTYLKIYTSPEKPRQISALSILDLDGAMDELFNVMNEQIHKNSIDLESLEMGNLKAVSKIQD